MKHTTAIYAGSFDPITRGHIDIVDQALRVFDRVIIANGVNPRKSRLFTTEEAKGLIERSVNQHNWTRSGNIEVHDFEGALVHYAEKIGADAIVRGLRQVSDFNDEFVQNGINSRLTKIPITYFICATEFLHVSSSAVKDMAALGICTDWLVYPAVEEALREKFNIGK